MAPGLPVALLPPHSFPLLPFRWNCGRQTRAGPVVSSAVLPEVLFPITCLLRALADTQCFHHLAPSATKEMVFSFDIHLF